MRIKRTLFSMIIFLSAFCLSAFFDILGFFNANGSNSYVDEKKPKVMKQTSIESSTTVKNSNSKEKSRNNKIQYDELSTKVKRMAKLKAINSNIGISVADSFVNIRKKASIDSKVLGKLYRNSAVEILDAKDDWFYAESGSVKGYVKSGFIKTGIPDKELVNKYGIIKINVMVDDLNVRSSPDSDSHKLTVVYENETYPVLNVKDNWVKVEIADDKLTGYVKKDYTEIIVDFKKAVSIEEELKLRKMKDVQTVKYDEAVKYGNGFAYSKADLKLLACLIHAEAGGQTYEGKLAVANVVLNRVKSGRFPSSIRAVIYSPGQFSVASSGSLAKQLANYNQYSDRQQLLSIKAAKAALEGANNIGSRLYFHSLRAAIRKGYDKKSTSVRVDDQLFW